MSNFSNKESIKYAIKLFAMAEGDVADRQSPGVDIFTALTPNRKIFLTNGAETHANDGLLNNGVHALSVKRYNNTNKEYRIDCETFEPVYKDDMNASSWWSVAMASYESPTAAARAIEKLVAAHEDAPVCLMSDVIETCEGSKDKAEKNAYKTLTALFAVKNQRRGLPSKLDSLPPRFTADSCMLVYDVSTRPTDRSGYWSNTRRQAQEKQNEETALTSVEHTPFA